jgi:phosphoribosylformylglycinamidine cyclo-ligase
MPTPDQASLSYQDTGVDLDAAFVTGRHDTVGQDLVNHCVNDILVQGARPLFFLDYLATGEMDEHVVAEVVRGMALACKENGCALLGGETAQMPDFYTPGEYDLAGFIVGLVERDQVLDGSRLEAGDVLGGLGSTGLQTNGYTLARAIVFDRMGLSVEDPFPGEDATVGEVLLRVHGSFLNSVLPLLESGSLHGLAHITGGGVPGNLPRVLPDGLGAVIDRASWDVPNTFRVLQEAGGVAEDEMFRVFNMGVGMIAVVPAGGEEGVVERLRAAGENAWVLGQVVQGEGVRL